MPCLSNGHHRVNIFHIPGKPAGIKNVMNFKKQEVTVACITAGLSGESDRQPGSIHGRIKKNREMTLPVRLIANPLSRVCMTYL